MSTCGNCGRDQIPPGMYGVDGCFAHRADAGRFEETECLRYALARTRAQLDEARGVVARQSETMADLKRKLDEARERLGMADQFDCDDGWQVCRLPRGWVVVDPDGDWISAEPGHHVALPQDDRRGYFPTADAAFAALAAARKEP